MLDSAMGTEITRKYILGESSTELDRIQGIHESTVAHMGKLLLAPVDFTSSRTFRILDSGTAAGNQFQTLLPSFCSQDHH
jgi:hypothetical protein